MADLSLPQFNNKIEFFFFFLKVSQIFNFNLRWKKSINFIAEKFVSDVKKYYGVYSQICILQLIEKKFFRFSDNFERQIT